jgi:hypothetical protein
MSDLPRRLTMHVYAIVSLFFIFVCAVVHLFVNILFVNILFNFAPSSGETLKTFAAESKYPETKIILV